MKTALAWIAVVCLVACAESEPTPIEPDRPAADATTSGEASSPRESAAKPATTPPAETDTTAELTFAPGTNQATVADTLVLGALHDYLVRASADQTLRATLRSDGPPTILVIENDTYRPDAVRPIDWTTSESLPASGGGAGRSAVWLWEGTLSKDGVYRVRVAHSGPAVNGGAVSPYALTIEIE